MSTWHSTNPPRQTGYPADRDDFEGSGDGDDETINIDLAAAPPNITRIVFPVSIHAADTRNQTSGQVNNAYICVVDTVSGSELARLDLPEDAPTQTAKISGELC